MLNPLHEFAAMDLINKHQVQAITGPRTWEEASLVAEVGSQAHVPILSCASATPQWASERWPFLIQASPNQQAEIEAVTAIIRSWGWHRVAIIYEDIDSVASEVIPHFTYALQDIGAEISRLVALPPFASSLSKELTSLKKEQCRVFVVHSSLSFATHMFQQANQMGMIEKGYVWITMDTITSLAHSLNASTISTMQGVVGSRATSTKPSQNFRISMSDSGKSSAWNILKRKTMSLEFLQCRPMMPYGQWLKPWWATTWGANTY